MVARPRSVDHPIRIQILHVSGCSLLDRVRTLVRDAVAADGVDAVVEEVEGDYASPTVLIDGVDVTGRLTAPGAACRLDIPTEAQLRAGLKAAEMRAGRRP